MDSEDYIETTYEGYAPNGVAVMVECTTDNNNRTVQNVRSIFNKYGGNLGTNGSVDYLFERKGVFTLNLPENFDEDELTLELIDAGAEDVDFNDGHENDLASEAQDIAAFLMWTAEPKMMDRKYTGFVGFFLLGLLALLLYMANKRLWAPVKGRKAA